MAPPAGDAAEKELQRLRRLPENRICPNCSKKDTLFGFSAVCVPFRTFVCSDCKSAHQAFSHRCKSVSMSNWTMDEVLALDERNGGGNRVAVERFLSGVPEGMRPRHDSSQDVLKQFINRAYNERAWEVLPKASKEHGPAQGQPGDTTQSACGAHVRSSPGKQAELPVKAKVNKPAAAPVANLLDDMFDASTPATQQAPAAVTRSASGGLLDGDLLGEAQAPVPTVPATGMPASAVPATGSALFGPFPTARAPCSSVSGPCAGLVPPGGAGAVSPDPFDPFAAPLPIAQGSAARSVDTLPRPTAPVAQAAPPCSGTFEGFDSLFAASATMPVAQPTVLLPGASNAANVAPRAAMSGLVASNQGPAAPWPAELAAFARAVPASMVAPAPGQQPSWQQQRQAADMFDPFAPVGESFRPSVSPLCVRA
mmetsp:Transcript_58684/g.136488  ORF Transcript_58684/g.136488 Transcript_58684/m.136488 type:complete len:425 (-) Transcript_58684:124-1398(-)|eukprot:CAMPEP_0171080730 /NCGR_PEP_ID=MMETSP0766_2-20121228/16044_1 /TAXON_ID=439317 /ORGANISM="Gambierdiscus australes, Strain CAWD 149" /LENGTH=424 /DNA_ID=CAMNT_0011537993 /DNA_START=51 /DNA_END=1325 /DNA_ORIENTATION=-